MSVVNQASHRQAASTAPADADVMRSRLRMMMLIRRFEERTYQEYTKPGQRIGGFCHLYSGQEAVAVGIAAVFEKGRDYLINGYRDHGHSLALGMDVKPAMAELFGRTTGCSGGKGGSMHFFQVEAGNMGGHGIVGGQIPLGAGLAFACRYRGNGGVAFTLFGDGALNQGSFAESMNLASLWKLPCIFICENNGMAMGTHVRRSSAESDLSKRGLGFAMPCRNVNGNKLDEVIEALGDACKRARSGEGPSYLVMNTYRFRGHSMSDPLKYRTRDELERARQQDPIVLYREQLRKAGLVNDEMLEDMEQQIAAEVDEAVQFANSSPHPEPQALFTDVLVEKYPLSKDDV